MSTATLDDFMALNDELAALSSAGVPLSVDIGPPGSDVASSLERINALVARRVSQGASLAEALEQEEGIITPSYRSLVLIGLHTGDLQAAFRCSGAAAESVADSWHVLRLSLVYPLIVACLAYAGFVAFCLFFVPVLEHLYADLQLPAGGALETLRLLRITLPYWVLLPPLGLALLLGWLLWSGSRSSRSQRRSERFLNWMPALGQSLYDQRAACFAQSLGELLEQGTALSQALPLAADACGQPAWGVEEAGLSREPQSRTSPLPPFLRWALWQSEAVTDRPRALRMAARFYRDSARRRWERWRVAAPMLAVVVLGGGVTLLYGLALFLPVVEMLRTLAH